jgi:hypothetical protein
MQDIAQKFELQGGRKQVAIELDFRAACRSWLPISD